MKRYLDTFDKAVRGINERDMFVTMTFPPDIPPTNTRDLINVVITRFTNTARFFSSVQVFLILKHFAAVFPPVLSTELKSLKSMSDQGFLSEQEYSDRRLILFDKYVPPRTRSGAVPPAGAPKTSSTSRATTSTRVPSSALQDKSGDEALAEVTRMLEESMRRTSDRRSANLETAAPPAYSGEILAQSTPPPRTSSAKSSGSTIGIADTSAFFCVSSLSDDTAI